MMISLSIPDWWMPFIREKQKQGYRSRQQLLLDAIQTFIDIPARSPQQIEIEANNQRIYDSWALIEKPFVCPKCAGEYSPGHPCAVNHCGGGLWWTVPDEKILKRVQWICTCAECVAGLHPEGSKK